MSGCARTEPFLEDTSNPIPVLVSKLAAGQIDPLRAARVELAEYGEAALPELRSLFAASWSEPFLAPRLQNVIEVVGMMRTDAGRDLLLRALEHPQPTVRAAAARALVKHARPEDFDKLRDAMPRATSDGQADFALAMLASDRVRAEHELVEWIGADPSSPAVGFLSLRLLDGCDPAVRAALKPLLPTLTGEARVHVQTLVAAQPDEEALSTLRGWLRDPQSPVRRQLVARDMARAGLVGELRGLLVAPDPDDALRKISVQALADAPYDDTVRELLRAALADASRDVRDVALASLVAHGDAGATDLALQGLSGSREELESALHALGPAMARDAALAGRVLDTLIDVRADRTGRGLVDERSILRAIGQVPLERAARYLMDAAATAQGEIQGQPAYRWFASTAGNTGPAGMAWLRSLWSTENDPVRRMDLVLGGTFEKTAQTRTFLSDVVESPRSTPPEILFAASRLVQFGPERDVAPLLKRVTLRVDDARIRPALNCLLWTWYGKSS